MYAKAKSSAFTEDKAPIATHEAWLVVVNLDWAGKEGERRFLILGSSGISE